MGLQRYLATITPSVFYRSGAYRMVQKGIRGPSIALGRKNTIALCTFLSSAVGLSFSLPLLFHPSCWYTYCFPRGCVDVGGGGCSIVAAYPCGHL